MQLLHAGGTSGLGGGGAAGQAGAVEGQHPPAGIFVVNRPQAGDQSARTGDAESAAQSEHALAGLCDADAGIAPREDHQFGAGRIERGNFFGGEDPVVLGRGSGGAAVGSGQRQARAQQRILAEYRGGLAALFQEESMRRDMDYALAGCLLFEGAFGSAGALQFRAPSAVCAPELGGRTGLVARSRQGIEADGREAGAAFGRSARGRGRSGRGGEFRVPMASSSPDRCMVRGDARSRSSTLAYFCCCIRTLAHFGHFHLRCLWKM